jgi:hypothetical protein
MHILAMMKTAWRWQSADQLQTLIRTERKSVFYLDD